MALNLLTGTIVKTKTLAKGVMRVGVGAIVTSPRRGTIRAGKGTIRSDILMPSHPLINFEILNYYQNEPKFNGVYSINNLPKIKDGPYTIKLGEYKSIETNWPALYVNGNNGSPSHCAVW